MDASFKFVMPSHPAFLTIVRATVGEIGTVYGLNDGERRGIILAVDEALANIIRHAYHGEVDHPIHVNCQACSDRLEFTLLDWGEPADPARIQAQPLDDTALNGRGTHLIRMMMDGVLYERVSGANRVTLSRRLPPSGPGAVGEPS